MKPGTFKTSAFYFIMISACLLILPLNLKSQSQPFDIGVEGAVWYFNQNYYPFGVGNPFQIKRDVYKSGNNIPMATLVLH